MIPAWFRRWRPDDDERGAYLIIWALLATALFTMIAVVIDMGQLRQTRRNAQLVADLSALAAGPELTATPQDPVGACEAAFGYIKTNVTDLPDGTTLPCNNIPAGCSPGNPAAVPVIPPTAPKDATVTAGPYTITVRYPIPQSEIADARFSGGMGVKDGRLCQRLRVTVVRSRDTTFGGVIGVKTLTTRATAVVRAADSIQKRIPSLWLLDPENCTSLSVSGSGTNVQVGSNSPRIPGIVTIDSTGEDCTGNAVTLETDGGATLKAFPITGAPGEATASINLVAMPTAATACGTFNPITGAIAHDCNNANFLSPASVDPFPERQEERATRAPVDWIYDCKLTYPKYQVAGAAALDVRACPDYETREAHLTKLHDQVNGFGNKASDGVGRTPSGLGWNVFPGAGERCNDPPATFAVGNWYVKCNSFDVKKSITFLGGNVVFDGDVGISTNAGYLRFNTANPSANLTGDCLTKVDTCVTASSANAAWVYLRKGNLRVATGTLEIHNGALYQDGGDFSFTAGGSPIWSAPNEGPFKSLAYWNETGSQNFSLSGGAAMNLDGIFFTPYAHPMNISGGGSDRQVKAQFVSQQAKITGGAKFEIAPDSANFVSLPPQAAVLIR